ncbi:MAG: GNAT family N-acetyltransferase [Gemmatimonadaceae bacterium]
MFSLRVEGELPAGTREAVASGLAAYNTPFIGVRTVEPLNVIVTRDDGSIASGLLGETRWQWFYIDVLWMADDTRGRHIGTQAMQLAEEEARRRRCVGAFVDTLDFQARGFYEKFGFALYGTLPNYPPGHERFYLFKRYDSV